MANSIIIYYISGTGMAYINNNLISDNESDYCVLIKLGILVSKQFRAQWFIVPKCLKFFFYKNKKKEPTTTVEYEIVWRKFIATFGNVQKLFSPSNILFNLLIIAGKPIDMRQMHTIEGGGRMSYSTWEVYGVV